MVPVSPGILYALVAAVVWGTYVFALKRYLSQYPASVLTVVVNAFAIVWYLPVAVTGLDAPLGDTFGVLTPASVAVAVGTDVALAGALVLFFRALSVGDVSYVTPINKLAPVFVLPVEIVFLGAVLTPLQVGGVVVATMAVYVANYRRGSLLEPLRLAARSRPAQLALVSAALFAFGDIGKRIALSDLALPTSLWVLWVFVGVFVLLVPGAIYAWPDGGVRADLPKFAVAGLFVAGGEHVTSLAFQLVPASIASPIINTQAVVAVLLGGIVLREAQFRIRLVAAGLAVAGVTLIAV